MAPEVAEDRGERERGVARRVAHGRRAARAVQAARERRAAAQGRPAVVRERRVEQLPRAVERGLERGRREQAVGGERVERRAAVRGPDGDGRGEAPPLEGAVARRAVAAHLAEAREGRAADGERDVAEQRRLRRQAQHVLQALEEDAAGRVGRRAVLEAAGPAVRGRVQLPAERLRERFERLRGDERRDARRVRLAEGRARRGLLRLEVPQQVVEERAEPRREVEARVVGRGPREPPLPRRAGPSGRVVAPQRLPEAQALVERHERPQRLAGDVRRGERRGDARPQRVLEVVPQGIERRPPVVGVGQLAQDALAVAHGRELGRDVARGRVPGLARLGAAV